MEAKEETSDTDSGIILHSGLDSPCTVMKDVTTHTRAVRLKLESLEERLEACVLELKKLCIREAELTGQLSSDYPLLPGEKLPQVRRRIGAAFKLDDQSLLETEASALNTVEAELALQQQIVVAARRLCQEGALSKAVRRSRQQQCRLEENKLKQLQEAVFQLRLQHGRTSPHPAIAGKRDHAISDDSSLSDSAVLDDEERINPASQSSLEPPHPEARTSGHTPQLHDHDRRHTPSPTHHTHTYTHTHIPPQSLIFRVPSVQHTHHRLSPSPSHTHNHLPSPTRSPSLRHAHAMTTPLLSPSPSHTHMMTSPLASPSLGHTHIMTTLLQSPSPSHTHVSLSPSLSPSPSVSCSLEGVGGAVVAADDDRPPIEHSPWSESSLDKPYEKTKTKRSSSRTSTSPAVTPTRPSPEMCVGKAGSPLPLPLPLGLKPTQSCSAPCTPEMQLRRGLSLRLPSSDDGYNVDQERGRLSRRRLTDLGLPPEFSPLHTGVGNPLYYSSSEDSASEHSTTSYTSSTADTRCLHVPDYGRRNPYGLPSDAASSLVPNGFYRNSQHQSTPSFSRAGCPAHHPRAGVLEAEPGLGPACGRYDDRYEEVALAIPAHVRLTRAPSLRDYPRLHPTHGPPREVVSDQLRSWHQRQQLHRPRPRSLDRHRQGAVRIRNPASRESPLLSQQPRRLDQPPQAGQVPRMVERNCGPWTTEDEAHIISQV